MTILYHAGGPGQGSSAFSQLGDTLADLAIFWDSYGDQLVAGGLGVTFVVLLVGLYVAHRRGRMTGALAALSQVMVLALSAEGMYEVARQKLQLSPVFSLFVFALAEVAMVSSAYHARKTYQATTEWADEAKTVVKAPGHPGKHGRTVWLIAVGAGFIVSLNSTNPVEWFLRFLLPVLAATLWWNDLTAAGTSRPTGQWLWTPRRLLVWVGAIGAQDDDLEAVRRERQVRAMVRVACQVHDSTADTWRRRRRVARLRRLFRDADEGTVVRVRQLVAQSLAAESLTKPLEGSSSDRSGLAVLRSDGGPEALVNGSGSGPDHGPVLRSGGSGPAVLGGGPNGTGPVLGPWSDGGPVRSNGSGPAVRSAGGPEANGSAVRSGSALADGLDPERVRALADRLRVAREDGSCPAGTSQEDTRRFLGCRKPLAVAAIRLLDSESN